MECPRCKSSDTKTIPPAANAPNGCGRVECVKCGRFVRWEVASKETRKVVASDQPANIPDKPELITEELGTPDLWLYVSKRLELEYLPNVHLYQLSAISFGSTTFYRLSARVLVWLSVAGEQLEASTLKGEYPREQFDEYLTKMDVVWAFAGAWLSSEAVVRARGERVGLPDAVHVK